MVIHRICLFAALALVLLAASSGCHRHRVHLRHKWRPCPVSCCETTGFAPCCPAPSCGCP